MTAGRPASPRLTRTAILHQALALAQDGDQPLTIRALARRMQVTPMAILHHVGSHEALLRAMADALLAPVGVGQGASGLEPLLRGYLAAVRSHPALTRALFQLPAPLPSEAGRITLAIEAELINRGLTTVTARIWRDILIDWAHGLALSGATEDPGPAIEVLLAAVSRG